MTGSFRPSIEPFANDFESRGIPIEFAHRDYLHRSGRDIKLRETRAFS
jgi:hypothetical protein